MKFDILTTFPQSFSALEQSIVKRAVQKGSVEIKVHNLRDYANDKHKTTDDVPFGGGAGMLMKIEPIYKALVDLKVFPNRNSKTKVILMSAKGELWNQKVAADWATGLEQVVIICGHYEGVDHRVVEHLIDAEISVGSYVLSGGEIPAMIIVDSVTRLLEGVINEDSLKDESHSDSFSSEYPQYTRPATFEADGQSWTVPEVLTSGNHKLIDEWKKINSK
jgi:tRNA (guanine37-N1)-methyltransferase